MAPHEIEQQSFAIIDSEAGDHAFAPDQWQIVRRMIHTSADFAYLADVRFHPAAVQAGIGAMRSGRPVFTDTRMAQAGISLRRLSPLGVQVHCLIADERVARAAAENGVTRAAAAVDAAAKRLDGAIYAVGNAPTALLRLAALVRAGRIKPALIVGLPVGFVNTVESKQELRRLDVPYITNLGRKGGSNLAAAVINALALLALEGE